MIKTLILIGAFLFGHVVFGRDKPNQPPNIKKVEISDTDGALIAPAAIQIPKDGSIQIDVPPGVFCGLLLPDSFSLPNVSSPKPKCESMKPEEAEKDCGMHLSSDVGILRFTAPNVLRACVAVVPASAERDYSWIGWPVAILSLMAAALSLRRPPADPRIEAYEKGNEHTRSVLGEINRRIAAISRLLEPPGAAYGGRSSSGPPEAGSVEWSDAKVGQLLSIIDEWTRFADSRPSEVDRAYKGLTEIRTRTRSVAEFQDLAASAAWGMLNYSDSFLDQNEYIRKLLDNATVANGLSIIAPRPSDEVDTRLHKIVGRDPHPAHSPQCRSRISGIVRRGLRTVDGRWVARAEVRVYD